MFSLYAWGGLREDVQLCHQLDETGIHVRRPLSVAEKISLLETKLGNINK